MIAVTTISTSTSRSTVSSTSVSGSAVIVEPVAVAVRFDDDPVAHVGADGVHRERSPGRRALARLPRGRWRAPAAASPAAASAKTGSSVPSGADVRDVVVRRRPRERRRPARARRRRAGRPSGPSRHGVSLGDAQPFVDLLDEVRLRRRRHEERRRRRARRRRRPGRPAGGRAERTRPRAPAHASGRGSCSRRRGSS